ncbi:MAG: hypothetical protein C4293_00930 [Nitrospiraceae bacterium]
MILLLGLSLGYVLPKLRAIPGAALASVILIGDALATQYLFVAHGVWLYFVAPTLTIAMIFVSMTVL